MSFGILLLVSSIFSVYAADQFIVTYSPDYLRFVSTEKRLLISEIPDLVKSTYGYDVSRNLKWNGVKSNDLFRRPEANVIFSIAGLGDKFNIDYGSVYEMDVDDNDLDSQSVASKLIGSSGRENLVIDFSGKTFHDIQAEYPYLFHNLPMKWENVKEELLNGQSPVEGYSLGTLNSTKDADLMLLSEVHLIHSMLSSLQNNPGLIRDGAPDLFHFKLGGLKEMIKSYGENSEAITDAINLLENFIQKMTTEFRVMYHDNVVVQLVSIPFGPIKNNIRKTRSLLADDDMTTDWKDLYNIPAEVDPLYPVIFNIILWMSILIGGSIIAVSIGLWNMDPGRDSIIYRMTSQRIKKD